MGVLWSFWVCAVVAQALAVPPPQVPLRLDGNVAQDVVVQGHTEKKRPLHGKFLHITGRSS